MRALMVFNCRQQLEFAGALDLAPINPLDCAGKRVQCIQGCLRPAPLQSHVRRDRADPAQLGHAANAGVFQLSPRARSEVGQIS